MAKVLVVGLVLLLLALAPDPAQDRQQQLTEYCEMAELRKTSGDPQLGWGDYKGIYESHCAPVPSSPRKQG